MSYLKALGVFRLVAEQADPAATLSWRGNVAHFEAKLSRDELITFFVEQYKPTPIVAPWNGGSGFAIVPEPTSVVLAGLGGVVLLRRLRKS